ncbi:ABC transporter ATP-binding protein [Halomontanus rarus]|uniref:ABC transporter ATP-binding protein n=1 Tax=Halomontanus rarus TaxID=3034020 RepID=UPI0023E8F925|nr:ABC transporter ATP-binding protein [Halovivax sp. TS33]
MTPTQHGPVAVSISNLTKEYGDGENTVTAVDDVSFTIERGEIVGLLGPNGAGKTTTIKMILNLIKPTRGEVLVNGIAPKDRSSDVYRDVSALLEGARNCYWQLTVLDNLHFFAGLKGRAFADHRDEAETILDRLDLMDKADEPVRNLSRGMKQKAALACALIQDTPILFLDEPTLGLDVEAAHNLRRMISELAAADRTIVICSHDMDLVQDICDRVIIMEDGHVVVNDTIANLVHIFDTTQYRFSVSGSLSSSERESLEQEYQISNFQEESGGILFDVLLESDEQFYDFVDRLRDVNVVITDVESCGTDLETAFLDAIGDTSEREELEVVQ